MIELKDGRLYDNKAVGIDAKELAALSRTLSIAAARGELSTDTVDGVMERETERFMEKSYIGVAEVANANP